MICPFFFFLLIIGWWPFLPFSEQKYFLDREAEKPISIIDVLPEHRSVLCTYSQLANILKVYSSKLKLK